MLANVLVRRPTVAFIDEPESHLHPTLQLDFLTTVASYCTEGSVMFATHNLGLARAASDHIYSCRRLELGVSDVQPLEATPHLAEFLGELGFSAYRDLGFDSVLLIDSERTSADVALAADRQAFVEQCRGLDIEILVLERRAIENYFTDTAVKLALGDSFSALAPYESLKDSQQPWAKRNNWRIAREMDRTELEGTDLGRFLAVL